MQVGAWQGTVRELAAKLATFVQSQVPVDLNLLLKQAKVPVALVYLVALLLTLDLK